MLSWWESSPLGYAYFHITIYDNYTIGRDSHNGGCVMVWAGVSLHHKTKIVFRNGNLTAAPFQHEVLDKEVFPSLRNLERTFAARWC